MLSEPLVAAVVASQLTQNEALWIQCLRSVGQSLSSHISLRDAGRTGELGAQLLILMAADAAMRPREKSLIGLVTCHRCEVADWIEALFTEDVRRQFMSVRPAVFADVQRARFGSANTRPVAKLPRARAGATDQVSGSWQ